MQLIADGKAPRVPQSEEGASYEGIQKKSNAKVSYCMMSFKNHLTMKFTFLAFIEISVGWIRMKFSTDIHVPLSMNCNHFCDALTFLCICGSVILIRRNCTVVSNVSMEHVNMVNIPAKHQFVHVVIVCMLVFWR